MANERTIQEKAMADEKIVREREISELRKEFEEFKLTYPPSSSNTAGTELKSEVVIDGFKLKSKHGAISVCAKILEHSNVNPQIQIDRVPAVPSVVPIKFD